MKITIITPTYNSANTIRRCIDSVASQNYSHLEYIFIDGESSDETIQILNSYRGKFEIKLISEPDEGIYDAMNKGIKIASGDIIGILNSDDLFKANDVIQSIVNAFQNDEVDAVYGDIEYFSKNIDRNTRIWRPGKYKESNLSKGWTIPHPSLYLRNRVYKKFGLYKTKFKLAADYELILRILKIHKINTLYLPLTFVKMYNGGTSAKNIKQRIKGWKELRLAWIENNLDVPKFFIIRRVIFKLRQYLFYK